MPLEGHYERQTTPLYQLSSRERKAALGTLAATVLALLVILIFAIGNSSPATAKGCINPNVAGIVGAETINACGQEAVDICQRASNFTGDRAETIVANCEQQGVKF